MTNFFSCVKSKVRKKKDSSNKQRVMERPPTTVRLCLDLYQHETLVELPMSTEGIVSRVRIIGWNAAFDTEIPFFQVRFDGMLHTTSFCHGTAMRSDCVQLPCASDNYVSSTTETSVPIMHGRDFPTRFKVSLFNASDPPGPLTPTRLVIWMEIDLI